MNSNSDKMRVQRAKSQSLNFTFFIFAFLGIQTTHSQPIYKTENLELIQLSPKCIVHISYLQTDDYGRVACNGLLYVINNEVLVVDTPADSLGTLALIQWIKGMNYHIKYIVPTHFHRDCLAGLDQFHAIGATSISNKKTIEKTIEVGLTQPHIGFENQKDLTIGDQNVILFYPGEGHTLDNIVCFIPEEKVLFGGCLIKALGAGKGFTDDGNTSEWSNSVEKVKDKFADVMYVIPGHGESGNSSLLDYTVEMFR